MSPFNFIETKIDAPSLDRKPVRGSHDSAPDGSGTEFDRMVADAAEKPKARGDAKECQSADSEEPADLLDADAASGDPSPAGCETPATPGFVDTAQPQAAPTSVAAAVAAVLLPPSEDSIWLPANIQASAAETPAATIAANINSKSMPQADGASVEPFATTASMSLAVAPASTLISGIQALVPPEANGDFAASLADLFEVDLSPIQGKISQNTTAAVQTTANTPLPFAVAPTTAGTIPAAANASAPAASLQVTSEAGAAPAEMTLAATVAIQPKEATSAKPAPAEETLTAQTDLTASTASKADTTALPIPRDFLREVATQYQATADAGSSTRAAGDAAPAEQISIRLIHSLHEGRKAVQIHLHPSELGSIDVAMQWKGDRLTAHFIVDRPETLDLLQRDIRILEQSLGDSGFKSDNGGLSFSLRQQAQEQAERQAANRTSSSDRTQNAAPETPADETSTIRDGVLVLRV